ncbi:MAG: hypothetical protein KDK56_02735 [Simkania sp.]|nr:hypothetical protein [Simkania sp.]MCP5490139.1 hypothetical protein [Chlamydiales bacterium]MCP5491327.1 hypothetical protein [Chlamydiales bacterium]
MGIISMDSVWAAYERVTNTLGGLRAHVNTGITKVTSGIEKDVSAFIDKTYGNLPVPIEELDKKDVVVLMDKIVFGAVVAKWATIAVAAASIWAMNYTSAFSPLLKVKFVVSLLAAHEFYQIQTTFAESKRKIDSRILGDKVIWWKDKDLRSISPFFFTISSQLATNLLFFSRSFMFGQEIRLLPNYIYTRIEAAKKQDKDAPHSGVQWVPDRSENLVTVAQYEEGLKADIIRFMNPMKDRADPLNSYHVADFALEALRPIAFARAAATSAALAFYLASAYLPLGWITFSLSAGAAFFAAELHQAHESFKAEVYQPLLRSYPTSLDEIEQLVNNACARVKDTTWILHKDFLFGKEIKQLPTFLHQLFDEKGDFEKDTVKWVEKSSLTAMVKTLKNWKIYKPQWLATT